MQSKKNFENLQWCLLESLGLLFYEAKVQLRIGIAQYKNAATPLTTRGINTTQQYFQVKYVTFFTSRGSKVET